MIGTRHPAGVAHYRGDVTDRLTVGDVKGPTTYTSLVVAVDVQYDAELDRTVATFAHCTEDDEAQIVRSRVPHLDVEGNP